MFRTMLTLKVGAAYARADELKRTARAVDIATSAAGVGTDWFMSAIAGKKDINALLEKAMVLLEKLVRNEHECSVRDFKGGERTFCCRAHRSL